MGTVPEPQSEMRCPIEPGAGFYEAGGQAIKPTIPGHPVRPGEVNANNEDAAMEDGAFERVVEPFNPAAPEDEETLEEVARRSGVFTGREETRGEGRTRWERTGRGKKGGTEQEVTADRVVDENAGRVSKGARAVHTPTEALWRLHWVGGHVPHRPWCPACVAGMGEDRVPQETSTWQRNGIPDGAHGLGTL